MMGRMIECICPICHAAIVAGVSREDVHYPRWYSRCAHAMSIAWEGGAWVVTFYSGADGESHVRCEDKDPLSINAVLL